ncbi:MAG: RsmE family RNA methyltransferase [Patescibacteria group bacterium]
MKLHRFFTQFDPREPRMLLWDKELTHQIVDILRLQRGEKVILCDGTGNEGIYTIARLDARGVELEFEKLAKNQSESRVKVTLHCCLLERENFEWVAQKAVETGIAEIHPVISRRTIKTDFKAERLDKIVKEAAEQAGRGIIPVVSTAEYFHDAAKIYSAKMPQLLFDAAGEGLHALNGLKRESKAFGIWIGPEGGWDPEEFEHAAALGFRTASLGNLTLRAETAAVIASYLACTEI